MQGPLAWARPWARAFTHGMKEAVAVGTLGRLSGVSAGQGRAEESGHVSRRGPQTPSPARKPLKHVLTARRGTHGHGDRSLAPSWASAPLFSLPGSHKHILRGRTRGEAFKIGVTNYKVNPYLLSSAPWLKRALRLSGPLLPISELKSWAPSSDQQAGMPLIRTHPDPAGVALACACRGWAVTPGTNGPVRPLGEAWDRRRPSGQQAGREGPVPPACRLPSGKETAPFTKSQN